MTAIVARNLPPLFPRTALHPATLAWADANSKTHPEMPWCVAFSGGADSLALLLLICAHWPERVATKKLIALHYNHHLRAEASDTDEKFCTEVCTSLGIPLHIGHWNPGKSQISNLKFETHATGVPSEAQAREARHAYFATEMAALGTTALWLGHQRDDIAETQLMRLARGSSTAGLAAPRPVHTHADGRTFLRPLLTLTKTEITTTLQQRSITWREDATNTAAPDDASGDYFRNRIRRDVIPAWIAAAENDALAGAALTRELLEEDAAALDAWLDELMPTLAAQTANPHDHETAPTLNPKLQTLNVSPLANKPRALLRRALRRWAPAAELARAGFEALIALCENKSTTPQISIGEYNAVYQNGILTLHPPANANNAPTYEVTLPLTPHTMLALPNGAWLTAEPIAITDELRTRIIAGEFDPIHTIFISINPNNTRENITKNTFNYTITARTWQLGDRYHPLGAPGSAKLSDIFVNRKIPPARRLTLPLICAAPLAPSENAKNKTEIIWAPGLPPAENWKITTKTLLGLRLTYNDGTFTVRP